MVKRQSLLATLVFGVVLLGAIDLRPMLRIPPYARPDHRFPLYPRFLAAVASRTSPGQSIAILAPMREGAHGYDYAYYRATYFLSGRRVIPLMDPDDSVHFDRLREGDWIAAWGDGQPPDGYEAIWRGYGGALYRRTR